MSNFVRLLPKTRWPLWQPGASTAKPPLTPFWLGVWACVLSLGWLLPNHYQPWMAFHADAWIAMVLALASAAVILRSNMPAHWHGVALLVAVLAGLPWLQYGFGLIPFAGQAWISTAYLLGLLLALLTGQRWEQMHPGQLAGGLFWAIGAGALVSVYLQFQTWLRLASTGIFDIWSMDLAGDRPYANLGQPNQLATLLLWGLLACAWAYTKQKIRGSVALLMASGLLLGIALTQSRTAWLGLTFLLVASWAWRRLWPSKWVAWSVTGLFAFFWTCPFILEWIADSVLLGSASNYLRVPQQNEARILVWRLFIDAALERPWLGYGWSELGHALWALGTDFPALHTNFAHSHNLFLDLILWTGVPIGLLVSVALIGWFVSLLRAVTNAQDALLLMFLGVVGIHAMLELPLHYAYFLLPTGLVMGVLNARVNTRFAYQAPRWTLMLVWVMVVVLLQGIVRDYFRVESSFQAVRYELARIGNLPVAKAPDVVFLTQLRERIRFLRYEFKPGMSKEELEWMLQVVNAYPGGGMFYKAATALALNDRPEEAGQWLEKICKISDAVSCDLIQQVWAQDALGNPLIAAVPWPKGN